jgi:hypothetical protein
MSSNTSTRALTEFPGAELSSRLTVSERVDAPTDSRREVFALFLNLLEKLTPPTYCP